jgi:choloylglycine hydrolase
VLFVNRRGVTKTGWEAGTSGNYPRWTSQYGSLTFNLSTKEMPWAGMNEAGLVISTMWLADTEVPPPDARPPLYSPLWVQYMLDTCATIDDVVANDRRVRIVEAVDHYLVCDRSAECAVVEFLADGTVFHRGADLPVNALTNHGYQEAAKAWKRGRLAENSLVRFGIAANAVQAFQSGEAQAVVDYAFQVLDRASGGATGGSPTQWSIVFEAENQRVYWRTSRNQEVRWVELNELEWESSELPDLIDVHTQLNGDLTGSLKAYDFGEIHQRTLTFVEKYHFDMSPFQAEVLQRGFQSFGTRGLDVPYQEERGQLVPPIAGWIGLTLWYRYWVWLVVVALLIGAWVVWRRAAMRGKSE